MDENPIIRNYMSIWSFQGLLEKGLHFRSLAAFIDNREGELSDPSSKWRRQQLKDLEDSFDPGVDLDEQAKQYWTEEKRRTFADCWRLADDGPATKWNIGEGTKHLAVETTVEQYAAAINNAPEPEAKEQDFDISIKSVAYHDYETDPVPEVPFTDRYFSKRSISEYEEEKEIRAVFKDYTDGQPDYIAGDFGDAEYPLQPENVPESHYIRCDLDTLIQTVHVGPSVPEYWSDQADDEESILDGMLDTYGVTAEVVVHEDQSDTNRGSSLLARARRFCVDVWNRAK